MSYGKNTRWENQLGGDNTRTWAFPYGGRNADGERRGVFAQFPASTPKYSTSNGDLGIETMARLIVPMVDETARQKFLETFNYKNSISYPLARAITSTGEEATGQRKKAHGEAGYTQFGYGYVDFLLSSVQEQSEERMQIVEVLSDNYISYFFGAKPMMVSCAGMLYNTRQDDWKTAFTILYHDVLRGTELARRKAIVTLSFHDVAISGVLTSMSQVTTAEMQMAVQFQFNMLVKRYDLVRSQPGPTLLASFPAAVQPSAFAIVQSGIAPITKREIQQPLRTVSGKNENTGEGVSDVGNLTPVYNATPENNPQGQSIPSVTP